MSESSTLSLDVVQPSQCYLNGQAVALATEWFDFDDPNYDSLLIRQFHARWTVTDGHTRTFPPRSTEPT